VEAVKEMGQQQMEQAYQVAQQGTVSALVEAIGLAQQIPASSPQKAEATQALNFFALRSGGQVNKLKALKLVYFADRYHLRRFGRPITGDEYLAMPFGPVASGAKDLTEMSEFLSEEERTYGEEFLAPVDQHTFRSVADVAAQVAGDPTGRREEEAGTGASSEDAAQGVGVVRVVVGLAVADDAAFDETWIFRVSVISNNLVKF